MSTEETEITGSNAIAEDRDLVIRLINNDQEAFCELYAKYKTRLLYFAAKFIKSNEFAEDIYQDAFAVIWQSRCFLDPEKSFSSYLYTVVKNRILNTLRDIENNQKLKSHILDYSIDHSDTTNQFIEASELQAILDKALAKLTPRQRQVFEMSRDAQLSHKEIAETLGISVFTVQEHISIALKTIKSYLKEYPDYISGLLLLLICAGL
ncbi:MAG TPA: RNA polymerase sigma-70 factor [Porphyromonadaceae bacterium]|jgi:RNA polymerase sigma-70 factor (ECF subfamily)|nr:RNA polymerase sigma-70 factor [Porphyromonadaceae bacterium]HBL34763.1 RNA polymerase sigma-70 factor [Porphyromonadaceae bacterium]HBX21405.1 RNA polymerase sigma-70 factor [Porphyromonadaceae bacterium]HCM21899.1 RNA polymerase sigma-70 factor [Porphyromonadaceae bacterium]